MAEPQILIGNNTEVDEDSNGDTILRNTNNGNSIKLDTLTELSGADVTITDDDDKMFIGDSQNWSLRYDATGTALVIRDEAAGTDIATFGDSGGSLDFDRSVALNSGGSLGAALDAGTNDISNIATASANVVDSDEYQDQTGNVITDFVGEGLDVVSNSLQILSSIWDGGNIVADVDNTNTTTGTLEADNIDTGRSWSNVTTSRSFNTTEANQTQSEIKAFVVFNVLTDGTTVNISATIDGNFSKGGLIRETYNTDEKGTVNFPAVPPGSTYEIEALGDVQDYEIEAFWEFRP